MTPGAVWVTGASSGLGLHTARALAQEIMKKQLNGDSA